MALFCPLYPANQPTYKRGHDTVFPRSYANYQPGALSHRAAGQRCLSYRTEPCRYTDPNAKDA